MGRISSEAQARHNTGLFGVGQDHSAKTIRMQQKVILITGASSGIGEACAGLLQRRGYRVYGASRRLRPESSGPFEAIQLDVNDDDSVNACVRQIVGKESRIDVVVNCAGFGIAGAVEDTSVEEAKAQFETNFFGVVRVCKAVLPEMRNQRAGLIINISSLGGMIAVPFQAFYSASKFALEGLTEALRLEVLPFGVRVVLVEPGDFNTPFSANRQFAAASQQETAYRDLFQKALRVSERNESNAPSAAAVARLVERIIESPSPRLRYSVGPLFERLTPLLKLVLPSRLTDWLTLNYFDLR